MTVERGRDWGRPGPLPDGAVLARSDAEVRDVVERARRSHRPLPVVGLLGGDLCRTLGGTGDEDRLRSADAMHLPVDLGAVLVDGRLHWFVAHLVARRRWLRGRIVAVMNAEWLGPWDVAPRAHPGDGRLDVIDVSPSFTWRDRLRARRRLPSGTHVPHPGLHQQRVDAVQFSLEPALEVWLDGQPLGRAHTLSVRVEADALTVVV